MSVSPQAPELLDVVIVGAGISGIGAAYRLRERNPRSTYAILEQRARIGGTWDLFRYPGVRSDSDIFSLSFPWAPWPREETIAEGADIRQYVTDAAHKYGIDRHIRFNTHVNSADWDSTTSCWTVTVTDNGIERTVRARFLFFGSGYYNYAEPYNPEIPGIAHFGGTVIHPQFWPEDLDYADKNVVVIGSGATAISLIPALAQTAAKVTMLQRSPTYVGSVPRAHRSTKMLRRLLPFGTAHTVARWYHALYTAAMVHLSRKAPALVKRMVRKMAEDNLPAGYDIDTHFTPSYNPWDQRMCAIPEADLFVAISENRADVVTDHIDHVDATGIALASGAHLDADIIVTATGLQLQALGGVTISLDGAEIKPQDRFAYKAFLLEDVPNLAWCVGYTNASWTLRADMTARSVAKLLQYMDSRGYTYAYPHLGGRPMPEKPAWDLQAGYVLRAPHALPRSGTKRPWNVRQNFVADAIDHRFDDVDECMVFGRTAGGVPARSTLGAVAARDH
ncbi:flavin-containing monooxygenase [Mycolicibacterium komossense]|uniref:NAD(P)/FAD-dependent oxidoreductase n=1 Tax=Mycolicibacterium komossense TaxID=1779 RepID=A0ABT3CM97_9MYCO|nr:NAD(P)/FAD-dependent oxidoreductase [Mycolicibacterium komossense]MCV7230386.1 NAD(P)/FAD-dependent oxidoreductase [Mycolicibacterium komossense]